MGNYQKLTMKVEILDNDIFNSFSSVQLENYLKGNDWREIHHEEKKVSIWERDDKAGHKYRVWLPLNIELADYGVAVGRLIKTVANAEDRSQLQLIEDLDTIATGDIIRASTWDAEYPLSDEQVAYWQEYGDEYMQLSAQAHDLEHLPKKEKTAESEKRMLLYYQRIGELERGFETVPGPREPEEADEDDEIQPVDTEPVQATQEARLVVTQLTLF